MSIFSSLDICPASRIVKIGDKTFKLDCDMLMLSHAEQVYAMRYGRDMNATMILGELINGKTAALMAIAYAALLSGGTVITWEHFAKDIFNSKDYDPLFDALSGAVIDMMSRPDSDDAPEGEEKN